MDEYIHLRWINIFKLNFQKEMKVHIMTWTHATLLDMQPMSSTSIPQFDKQEILISTVKSWAIIPIALSWYKYNNNILLGSWIKKV